LVLALFSVPKHPATGVALLVRARVDRRAGAGRDGADAAGVLRTTAEMEITAVIAIAAVAAIGDNLGS